MARERRQSVVVGDTRLVGPIPHQRCPACGNTVTIFKETTTYPYTLHDALSDHAFGISPWWGLLFPRRRTRLRCAQCNCQFPARWHPATRLFAQSLALAATGALVLWAYPHRTQLWGWLLKLLQSDPLVVLVVGGVAATALLVIIIVVAYPRRRTVPLRTTGTIESAASQEQGDNSRPPSTHYPPPGGSQ
jgi:hypothetical protein